MITSAISIDVTRIHARQNGIAGQFSYAATVEYSAADFHETHYVAFYGTDYGHSVVIVTEALHTFVTDPGRYGPALDPQWITNYYAA